MSDAMDKVRDKRDRNWFWIENEIVDRIGEDLGAYGIALYAVLARHADAEGRSFPSIPTLARMLGCTEPTVRKYLAKMESLDVVSISPRSDENGRSTSHLYTILGAGEGKRSLGGRVNDVEGEGKRSLGGEGKRRLPEQDPFINKTQIKEGPRSMAIKELNVPGTGSMENATFSNSKELEKVAGYAAAPPGDADTPAISNFFEREKTATGSQVSGDTLVTPPNGRNGAEPPPASHGNGAPPAPGCAGTVTGGARRGAPVNGVPSRKGWEAVSERKKANGAERMRRAEETDRLAAVYAAEMTRLLGRKVSPKGLKGEVRGQLWNFRRKFLEEEIGAVCEMLRAIMEVWDFIGCLDWMDKKGGRGLPEAGAILVHGDRVLHEIKKMGGIEAAMEAKRRMDAYENLLRS